MSTVANSLVVMVAIFFVVVVANWGMPGIQGCWTGAGRGVAKVGGLKGAAIGGAVCGTGGMKTGLTNTGGVVGGTKTIVGGSGLKNTVEIKGLNGASVFIVETVAKVLIVAIKVKNGSILKTKKRELKLS